MSNATSCLNVHRGRKPVIRGTCAVYAALPWKLQFMHWLIAGMLRLLLRPLRGESGNAFLYCVRSKGEEFCASVAEVPPRSAKTSHSSRVRQGSNGEFTGSETSPFATYGPFYECCTGNET